MKNLALIGAGLALLLVSGVPALAACTGGAEQDPDELSAVEIIEYQGEKLGSVNDFRENSIAGPQYVDMETYKLQVVGLVDKPADYEYENVIKDNESYNKVVTLDCVEGWSVKILWEGDLIEKSGLLPEAKVVIFHAYDGYTTSFPVEYVMDNDILLAYKMNDIEIPPERGYPFQLVAESKWGYKWMKWVTGIELSDNEDYRGYWESRGYSNNGSIDQYFFD
jgi:DMSO/TMAO reductase YedYZ molybdopterin-dependent catalytic subunit